MTEQRKDTLRFLMAIAVYVGFFTAVLIYGW